MTISFVREQYASAAPAGVPLSSDVPAGSTLVVITSCVGDGVVSSVADTQRNKWGVFGANGITICWAVNIAAGLSQADDSLVVEVDGDTLDAVYVEQFAGPLSVQGASFSGRDGVDDPPAGWLSVFAFFANPEMAAAQDKAKSSLAIAAFPSNNLGSRSLRTGYSIARATGDHWVSFPTGGVTLSLSDSPPVSH